MEDISKEAGSFVKLEIQPTFVRTRVVVDGLAPILTDTLVEFHSGESITAYLEYERLDYFCSLCKRLTHSAADCELRAITSGNEEKQQQSFSTQGRRDYQSDITRKATRREDFHQRLDRHGRPFGERPSSRSFHERTTRDRASMETGSTAPKHHNHRREPSADKPNLLETRRFDKSYYDQRPLRVYNESDPRHEADPIQTLSLQRQEAIGGNNNLTYVQREQSIQRPYRARDEAFRTPIQYVWKEKTPLPTQDQREEVVQTLAEVRPLERNLAIADFPQTVLDANPDEDEATLNATIRYINHPDPIESLARRYRVLQGGLTPTYFPQPEASNQHLIPEKNRVVAELEDLTTQYVNCANPIERAARQQRVLVGEENNLILETATAIVQAAVAQAEQQSSTIRPEATETAIAVEQPHKSQLDDEEAELGQLAGPSRKRGRPQGSTKSRPSPSILFGASSRKRNASRVQNSPRRHRSSVVSSIRRSRNRDQQNQILNTDTTDSHSNGSRNLQREHIGASNFQHQTLEQPLSDNQENQEEATNGTPNQRRTMDFRSCHNPAP